MYHVVRLKLDGHYKSSKGYYHVPFIHDSFRQWEMHLFISFCPCPLYLLEWLIGLRNIEGGE
jgi:hypothetical protein